MGCGSWTSDSFKSYSKSVGRSVSKSGVIDSVHSNQEMFKARYLDSALDPKNVAGYFGFRCNWKYGRCGSGNCEKIKCDYDKTL